MKSNKAHRLQTVLAYVVLVILSFYACSSSTY